MTSLWLVMSIIAVGWPVGVFSQNSTKFDVIICIDGSSSIGYANFVKLLDAVYNSYIKQWPVGDDQVRVGLMSFSTTLDVVPMTGNLTQLRYSLFNLFYEGRSSNTHLALQQANNMFLSAGRAGVEKVCLMITDSRARLPLETRQAAEQMRVNGIDIYAVGVGTQYSLLELYRMTADLNKVNNTTSFDILPPIDFGLPPAPSSSTIIVNTATTTSALDLTSTQGFASDTTTVMITTQPTSQSSVIVQPTSQSSIIVQPTSQSSVIVQPTSQSSIIVQPSSQSSVIVQPTSQSSVIVQPTSQSSIIVQPSSQSSIIVQPTSQSSVIVQPTLQSSVLVQPTSQSSVIVQPTSQSSIIVQPTSQSSIIVQPSSQSSVIVQPTSQSSVIVQPTSQSSIIVQPTSQSSIIVQPSSQSSIIVQPTSQSSIIVQPSSQSSVIVQPTSQSSIIVQPSSQSSITVQPTSQSSIIAQSTQSSTVIQMSSQSSVIIQPTQSTSGVQISQSSAVLQPSSQSSVIIQPTQTSVREQPSISPSIAYSTQSSGAVQTSRPTGLMTSLPSWSGAHPTPSPTDGFYLSSTVSRSQDRWSVSTHWTIQHSSTALPSEPSSVIVTPPPAPPTTLPPDTRGGDGSVSFNDTDLEAGVCVFAHSKQGFGFAPHAQDCDKYFQCHLSDDGKVTASVRYCPRGLFWSQENLTCVEPSGCNSVSTCRDPCEFKDDGDTYRMEGGCGMYWECHKGVSRGRSCRREEAYIPGRGCEYSPDCPYVKLASGHCDDTCDAHPLSDRSGYWTQGNFGRYKVTCLDSTRFDLASCSCKYQRYFDPVCQFKTVLEYNPDQWTNDTFTRTKTDRCENICVHPRSNRPLALTLSYRRGSVAGSRTMQKEEVLVRSKECNKGGLFALTEDGEALKVRIFSKSGQSVVTSLPLLGLNTTAWKQVSIEYSRGNVVITVSTGQLTYTVFTKGGPQVQVGVCGWQVGDPGDLSTVVDRFTGDFKQARLSRCFDYGS